MKTKTQRTEEEQMTRSTKQPDNQPSIPFRYLRRKREIKEAGYPVSYYETEETALQWLDPDGVWRDVPTVEEGTSDEQTA